MNDKQRSSNDEPNRNFDSANEKQLAEQTVRVLELRPLESLSKDDQATAELGQLLRDAAQANLPESNLDLREQLLAAAALNGGSSATESSQAILDAKTSASKELTSSSTGRRRFWIAAAASGLLLVGGTIAYNSGFVGSLSNVALLEQDEQPNVGADTRKIENAGCYFPDGNENKNSSKHANDHSNQNSISTSHQVPQ